jgi:hypothetical protein
MSIPRPIQINRHHRKPRHLHHPTTPYCEHAPVRSIPNQHPTHPRRLGSAAGDRFGATLCLT